ncbi:MAG: glycosyltransferase family 4 protein [Actinomycetota bacterium]|nr:glycosyltransferase family 4 protein [Actinomycetota bacterium]
MDVVPATSERPAAEIVTVPEAASSRFAFVMEQTLGHVSFAQNLKRAVDADGDVDVAWIEIGIAREEWWEALPALGANWSLRASLKARRALERERRSSGQRDLYLFHTQVVSLLSSGWLRGSPPVVVSLDATPLNYDRVGRAYGHASGRPAAERFKFWLNRRAFANATFLVTWSDWARRSLIDDYGVEGEKIEVIPPGTDLGFWRADGTRRGGEKVRMLFVGGDFERKGGSVLLDVFRRHLVGTCELHVVTKAELPREAGVVVHRNVAPNSPELRALFGDADLFVLPTEGDVHSIASIEAMAAGLPVVSTAVGAIPEVVLDGETGFLVPPGDRAALASALGKLVHDEGLRRTIGERGRRRAGERFDARKNGERLLAVCKALAADDRRSR